LWVPAGTLALVPVLGALLCHALALLAVTVPAGA
jgi:hypothetical protein